MKHDPERYIAFRDDNGKLVEVHDKDTGRIWKKVLVKNETGWIWID